MIYEKKQITCEGSLENVWLHLYLLDVSPEINIRERPLILICPGGGYEMTSDREGEIVAMQFLSMGYHVAILRYSVAPATFPTALFEVGESLSLIRKNAGDWSVDPEKLLLCGFSAGGHLAASYGCFWKEAWVADKLGAKCEVLRPNGMILGYPVITSGAYAHHDSIRHLLGDKYEEKKADMSLENFVTKEFPKTFLWHTFEDGLVPPQNSLLLVEALLKQQIPAEFHMFAKGGHGLSLANHLTKIGDYGVEKCCESWMPLVRKWLEDNYPINS